MEGPRQYVQVLTGPPFSRSREVPGERWNWHLSSIVLMLKVYPTFRNGAVLTGKVTANHYFVINTSKIGSKPADTECPGRLK